MDERVLIFRNLLNGVPAWQAAREFRRTEADVMGVFRFIGAKLKSYCFERCQPPVFCDSIEEARRSRLRLLLLADRINLDKDPRYVVTHERVTPDNILDLQRLSQ